MTEEYIKDYMGRLLKVGPVDSGKESELTDEFVSTHLKECPQKLYKYRVCNRQNFKTLRDGKIYMPFAKDFEDIFDSTIKFDISSETEEFKKLFLEKIDIITWLILKHHFEGEGRKFEYSLEQSINIKTDMNIE